MKNNKTQIIIIFLLIIILSLLFAYTKLPIFINKSRINKYISDNDYKLEDYYIYTSTTKNNNITIIQKVLYDNYYFTKSVIENNNDETTKINYYYTKDKEIVIEYEHSVTIDNEFKMESINATFKNNNLIKCENLLGDLSCDNLKIYAKNYEDEINNILKVYDINIDVLDKIKLNK